MSAELRKSGLAIIGDVSWGTHFCQFYQTAQDLLDILVPYFRAGLESNEFCMWITSEPLGRAAAERAMQSAVPGFERHVREGRIEIVPYTDWYLRDGRFDSQRVLDAWIGKLEKARAGGFDGLRLSGNTFWLEKSDWKTFTDYEAAIDQVIGRYRMLAACTYSLDRCGAREVLDVIRNHRFALVRRGAAWEVIESADNKRAREGQRESEEKYRLLFENMAEGFALYELVDDDRGRPVDWRVLEVNAAYTRHTGVTRKQIVGRRMSEVFPDAVLEYLPGFASVVETGAPLDIETHARSVGRYLHVVSFPAGGRRFANIIEDITKRRIAEDALRDSEERYRSLFNNMTEGFALHEIVTDETGRPCDYRFLDVNPAFERLTGLRRPDIMGRRVLEVLQNLEPYWIETFGRVTLTGEPITFERYYPAPLNRWYEVHAFRPAPRQFAVVFIDITWRKRTEEALSESEKRHERTQEIAHLGSWELDRLADRLTWSDEVYRIFGLIPKDFAATYEAFLAAVHPDDRAAVDDAYISSQRDGRDTYEIEHRVVRRDTGEVRIVHEKCEHFRDASGRIVRSVGMVHDITERKSAESLRLVLAEQERLRLGAAVEQASEAVIMADPDGRVLYVNAAFETINGRDKAAAVGGSYFDLVAGDPRLAEMKTAVARGEAWHCRVARLRPDDRPIELEVTISSVKGPSGELIGVLITERDVTQEVLLQAQVRQTQKMEALGTLAGGIAHDFNNILLPIMINTELVLSEEKEDAPAARRLSQVLDAARRGKDMVRQIIAFSQQREQDRKPIEIAPVVRETLKLLRISIPKNIEIVERIKAGSAVVEADPTQVQQVLMNLCNNAAHAMREKGGTLEIGLSETVLKAGTDLPFPDVKPGAYILLSLKDSGQGIPPEIMPRIFEPFFTTKNKGEGTGMGLAMVHGIVKSHGGAITVASNVGKGSEFTVYLPRVSGEVAEARESRAPLPKGTERILFVDDEDIQVRAMTKLLEHLGYRVLGFTDAVEALEAFRTEPGAFDLAIMDQTMPRLSGGELARELLLIKPGLRIILCSGYSETFDEGQALAMGIRAFIMKPFSAMEIAESIRRVLAAAS